MRLCFLVPPATVLPISLSETLLVISSDCVKLFKRTESTSSLISSRIMSIKLAALEITPKAFLLL